MQIKQTDPIQQPLSNMAFKYLYSYTELQNRTKRLEELKNELNYLIESTAKPADIDPKMTEFKEILVNMSEFYKKKYEVVYATLLMKMNKNDD